MDKIKAADPEIIVGGKANKPYYQIKYYDISDNEWHIGYGSYCLANVKEWLKTCFEVTNADVTPVKHGHWQKGEVFERLADEVLIYDYTCTCCGWSCRCEEKLDFNFCPNCGADMRENT